ncbi:MAG TPA: potassium transporter TrkG [Candidatus Thalassarchaeaceae archaeon]|jgi:trk system potassium uptake protein TrkH|nr:potassium transporter TrkG [Candidatus Thalassarchaeaceae archaeon]|tara:strand:+ start:11512 stop:13089 length:1578 start_codon:yes stop_codon:yes gene_type:complete
MRWEVVGLVLGWTIGLVSLPLVIVALFSCFTEGLEASIRTFSIPLILSLLAGYALVSRAGSDDASSRVRDREAFASVALGWIPVVVIGAMPYWLGGMFFGPFGGHWYPGSEYTTSEISLGLLHSWFESMSGFTTTGASLIDVTTSPVCGGEFGGDCVSSQRDSLILWRSLSQWLGGMGVIMLGLLIFSRALGGGMALARAELTGPSVSNLGMTLESTARRLWGIYVGLTAMELFLLSQFTDMGLFDSVNYALTTMPSGGFGTSDQGIMDFDDSRIEFIIMIFMLLTCINFSLLYFAFAGRTNEVWKDEELRTYLLIIVVAWFAMAFNLVRSGDYDFVESIRHSLFQAISISSTGYSSADFSQWPVFSQFVLLLLMIVGASAGSTGGGLKVLRIRIAFELAKREVIKIIHPRKVVAIRFNRTIVDEEKVWIILGMVSSWLVLVTASMLTISFLEPNLEMTDVLSVSISLLGNTGPALGSFGPAGAAGTWASLSIPSLLASTILMWLGRLELLTVLVLLHPRTWESN